MAFWAISLSDQVDQRHKATDGANIHVLAPKQARTNQQYKKKNEILNVKHVTARKNKKKKKKKSLLLDPESSSDEKKSCTIAELVAENSMNPTWLNMNLLRLIIQLWL